MGPKKTVSGSFFSRSAKYCVPIPRYWNDRKFVILIAFFVVRQYVPSMYEMLCLVYSACHLNGESCQSMIFMWILPALSGIALCFSCRTMTSFTVRQQEAVDLFHFVYSSCPSCSHLLRLTLCEMACFVENLFHYYKWDSKVFLSMHNLWKYELHACCWIVSSDTNGLTVQGWWRPAHEVKYMIYHHGYYNSWFKFLLKCMG